MRSYRDEADGFIDEDWFYMNELGHRRALYSILVATLIITIGYGVSFPLLAIRLEAMQVASGLIGINAAMPALGWLLLTPILPRLHKRFSSKTLMIGFLCLSLLGLIGFTLSENFVWWLLCRFAFGGGLGMFFRVVEYWLNTATQKHNRGRIIGIYSFCFLFGIAVGSLLQPELGTDGIMGFIFVGVPVLFGMALIAFLPRTASKNSSETGSNDFLRKVVLVMPIAMAGVIAYGLFEDVPAYLLSVYTLKMGLGENIAAYTLSAFALGNLLFAVPLGIVSDKVGRVPVMITCALVGFSGAIFVPLSLCNSAIFLSFLVIWGGFIGALYSASLAYIGDRFSESALITANAAFGTIYAAAAMLGPILNGFAMQIWEPQGLMLACAIIFGTFLLFGLQFHRKGGRDVATKAL